eukprot:1431915-Alexandrium_andersonii.AAC.1
MPNATFQVAAMATVATHTPHEQLTLPHPAAVFLNQDVLLGTWLSTCPRLQGGGVGTAWLSIVHCAALQAQPDPQTRRRAPWTSLPTRAMLR